MKNNIMTYEPHEQQILRQFYAMAKEELERSLEIYPLFQSPHEAHAVLDEEVMEALEEMQSISETMDYLKDEIRRSKGFPHEPSEEEIKCIQEISHDIDRLILEAVQCKAMIYKHKQSFLGGEDE